jgi:ribosomal protein S18 acetylase RimI-like enzyme
LGDLPALAEMLATQSPWTTLGFDRDRCLALVSGEPYGLRVCDDDRGQPAGFLLCEAAGCLGQPYLKLLAVRADLHGQGIGTALLDWLEADLFERAGRRNLFLCVSGFNDRAQAFYRARGFVEVGRLTDYLVSGEDELLMRKAMGPLLDGLGPQAE